MENSTQEPREEIKEEQPTEEKTHSNLKGTNQRKFKPRLRRFSAVERVKYHVKQSDSAVNGGTEEAVSRGEKLHNGDGGGGGGGIVGAEGGGDLSSINAMMSAVMSATGTINGGGDTEAGSGVTSANSSAVPSPR